MMSSEPSTPVCPYPTLDPVSDTPSGDRKQSCPLPTAPEQDHHHVDESIVAADPTTENVHPLQAPPKQAQVAYYIEQHQEQPQPPQQQVPPPRPPPPQVPLVDGVHRGSVPAIHLHPPPTGYVNASITQPVPAYVTFAAAPYGFAYPVPAHNVAVQPPPRGSAVYHPTTKPAAPRRRKQASAMDMFVCLLLMIPLIVFILIVVMYYRDPSFHFH